MNLGNITKIKELFKFSWAQAFSDENGKSSVFSMTCFIVVVTGCLGFLFSLVLVMLKDTNAVNCMMYSSGIITAGLAALTGRKMIVGKPGQLPTIEDDPKGNQ
jgi:hypothetical protein